MLKFKVTFQFMQNHEWTDWFSIEMLATSAQMAREAAHAMLNKEEHENCTCIVEELK